MLPRFDPKSILRHPLVKPRPRSALCTQDIPMDGIRLPPEEYSGLWKLLRGWFPADLNFKWTTGKYAGEEEYTEFLDTNRGLRRPC
jgi:hypothetical protein